MNVLLVDPPGRNKGINTGLGYLAAVLQKEHRVSVLDLNNLQIGLCGDPNPDFTEEEILFQVRTAIEQFRPDILGVSIKTFTAQIARSIFRYVKKNEKGTLAIAGGPHITLDGLQYVKDTGVDFGIMGEGESSLPALCKALEGGEALSEVGGLLYRKNGEIAVNPKSPAYGELDELPFPDYMSFSSVQNQGGELFQYPILTSRGCPFSCTYCSMPKIMGRTWRSHSPSHVINELIQAKKKYSSTSFTVVDDAFTLKLDRAEEISDQLISSGLNLRWNSQNGIRADRITKNLAEKMKRSGCYHVWIGIESADQKVFNAINKGEKLESIRRGIEILKKAGIRVGGFFIVGLPYSTRKADLKSVEFVKKLKIDAWWFNFVPYPFTEAWDWVRNNARILRSPEGVLQYGSSEIELVFETDDYREEERINTYKEIHYKMGYFDRLFDPSLGFWNNFYRLFKEIKTKNPLEIPRFLIFTLKYSLKQMIQSLRKHIKNNKKISFIL